MSRLAKRPGNMPIYSLAETTPPTTFPFQLSELKDVLGISNEDVDDDDALIIRLRAATIACERYTRRSFINRTLTLWMDRFPGEPLPWWNGVRQMADTELTDLTQPIYLPRPPLASVTHVKTHSESGESIFDSSLYFVDVTSEPGRVVLKTTASWPTTQLRPANGVEIEYVAGYGATGQDVPAPIRDAIMVCVGAMQSAGASGETLKFEKVGDSSLSRFGPDESGSTLPSQARNLLSTYKIWMV